MEAVIDTLGKRVDTLLVDFILREQTEIIGLVFQFWRATRELLGVLEHAHFIAVVENANNQRVFCADYGNILHQFVDARLFGDVNAFGFRFQNNRDFAFKLSNTAPSQHKNAKGVQQFLDFQQP